MVPKLLNMKFSVGQQNFHLVNGILANTFAKSISHCLYVTLDTALIVYAKG